MLGVTSFAQVQTTEKEYNYFTEEYPETKTVLEGYTLEKVNEVPLDKYNYKYDLLIEEGSKEMKGMLIEITKGNKERFLFLPVNNMPLYQKFHSDVQGLGITMGIYLDFMNNALISKMIDEKYNKKQ